MRTVIVAIGIVAAACAETGAKRQSSKDDVDLRKKSDESLLKPRIYKDSNGDSIYDHGVPPQKMDRYLKPNIGKEGATKEKSLESAEADSDAEHKQDSAPELTSDLGSLGDIDEHVAGEPAGHETADHGADTVEDLVKSEQAAEQVYQPFVPSQGDEYKQAMAKEAANPANPTEDELLTMCEEDPDVAACVVRERERAEQNAAFAELAERWKRAFGNAAEAA